MWRAPTRRIGTAFGVHPIRRPSDRQRSADLIDTVDVAMIVDDKQIIASVGGRAPPARNTGTPCAGSHWPGAVPEPRSRSLSRACSAVVVPARCLRCRSAWLTPVAQRLARHPRLRVDRARRRALGLLVLALNIIPTPRFRISSEYLLRLCFYFAFDFHTFNLPSHQNPKPPTFPGAIHTACRGLVSSAGAPSKSLLSRNSSPVNRLTDS